MIFCLSRQKTAAMKTKLLLLFISLVALVPSSLFSQTSSPDVHINVKVKRDSLGNIVSYDSTVVMTWGKDVSPLNADSLFNAMKNKFDFSFPFEEDSLFNTFFSKDPFFDMEKEFRHMDENGSG